MREARVKIVLIIQTTCTMHLRHGRIFFNGKNPVHWVCVAQQDKKESTQRFRRLNLSIKSGLAKSPPHPGPPFRMLETIQSKQSEHMGRTVRIFRPRNQQERRYDVNVLVGLYVVGSRLIIGVLHINAAEAGFRSDSSS